MVLLSIANPEIRIIEERDNFWAVAGVGEEGCRSLRVVEEGETEVEADLCRRYGDATVIRVRQIDGKASSITAWKGITSYHEVFYRILPGAEIVISDHFRNIISHVPVADRVPSKAALCDHFLFRALSGGNTFCESVKRLERGVRLDIDPAAGAVTQTLFDTIEKLIQPGSLTEYLDRVDVALETALSPYQTDTCAAMLFSGGVDSTLLQTYLPSTIPPVSYVLPHYTKTFEAEYGSRSAAMLGLELEKHQVGGDDFIQRLENVISATAMPPPHIQFVFYQTLFGLNYQRFIMGENADAVFGLGVRRARLASYFVSPLGQIVLRLFAQIAFGAIARRTRQLRETSLQLAEPPDSINGYGARSSVYTDLPLVEGVFGHDYVCERLAARLALVRDRLEEAAPSEDVFLGHLETAHMMDLIGEEKISCFRHLAHAFGKTIFSPFMSKAVIKSALSIPVGKRYLRRTQGKYILKHLLKRRLPGYPVNQPKGYMTVHFIDYYRSGPLSEVWKNYEVPELFQGEYRDRLLNHPSQVTWNAITLAIWKDKIAHNAQLQAVDGSKTLSWS